jgi:hypothetical protein
MHKISAFAAFRRRARLLLAARGYEPVMPVGCSYLSRFIPLHLIGLRGDYEALCVKLRMAYGAVSVPYAEALCRYEICQFRSFLRMDPGNVFLRCEVWVVSPNGAIHCFEVTRDGFREVAADAR